MISLEVLCSMRGVRCLGVFVLLFMSAPSFAQPESSQNDAKVSLLFVGPIAEKQNESDAMVGASIHQRIMAGLRSQLAPENRFGEAISSAEIEQERSTDLTALTSLRKGDFNSRVVGQILNRFSTREQQLTGYLRPTVRRVSEHLEVDLELYRLDAGSFKLDRMISVGGCGMSDSKVLDALFAAAAGIASRQNERPVVAAQINPSASVKVGQTVTLSSCGSIDPNYDALSPSWRVYEHPTNAAGIPRFAVSGRVFQFTPTEPGDYRIELTVREVLDTGQQDSTKFLVRVFEPAEPQIREGQIINVQTKTTLELESAEQGGVSYRWRQTGGPLVELNPWDPASSSCQTSRCTFAPQIAGKYSFELTAYNELGVAKRQVHYLVTDPWRFETTYEQQDTATHLPKVLQTNRVPAEERRYIWKLREPEAAAGEAEEHAWLFEADTATPTFLADRPGVYTIDVTSAAEYELDGRSYERVQSGEVQVRVQDRALSVRWVPANYFTASPRYEERDWLYATRFSMAYAFRRNDSETSFGPRASIGLLPIRVTGGEDLDTSFDLGGQIGYRIRRSRANFLFGYERVGGDYFYGGSDFVWALTSAIHLGLEVAVGVEANVARPPTILLRSGALVGVEL